MRSLGLVAQLHQINSWFLPPRVGEMMFFPLQSGFTSPPPHIYVYITLFSILFLVGKSYQWFVAYRREVSLSSRRFVVPVGKGQRAFIFVVV